MEMKCPFCDSDRVVRRPIADQPILDAALQQIAQKIAEMSLNVDGDPAIPAGDTQWRKGYKQACSDIVLMVCQFAKTA